MSSHDAETATTELRYVVDTDLCAGHGRCYTLDPEHFESDDVGYPVLVDIGLPMSERSKMEDIIAACPEGAISITESPVS